MYNPQAWPAGHKESILEQPQYQGWTLRPSTVDQGLEGLPGCQLLILHNPGNPSGCAYTRKELDTLVKVFRSLLVILHSDEICTRIEYTSQHVLMSELCLDVTISANFYTNLFPPGHNSHVGFFQVVKCRRLEAWLRPLSLTLAPAQEGHHTSENS